ncbi:MAG: response regulator [Scytolyngbya sp. HA4215-MV1]|jgi:CheY-like chemotaxis protein|nr:response regulator [Scytolyngbya sp. HA4215-MV1]
MKEFGFGHFNSTLPELSLKGIKILAIDDNPECCGILSMLFKLYEAEAQVVTKSSKALELLLQWQPQVWVIDIALPIIDGFELLNSIRSLEAKQGLTPTPAIAITARLTPSIEKKAYQVGYSALFAKPLQIDNFVATLMSLAQTTLPASLQASPLKPD